MSGSLLLQYLVIALAVLASAWVVLKKQFPNTARRLRVAVALPLLRDGRPAWMQALGRRVAPPASGGAGGCDGCSSCGPGKR
ncbi:MULTISPECIES: DUF6587 family protein [Gammaproteobacteria]|uniref:DUF6587 family protein n=1 Tax=Gammaproteobacteria TaxID=1236 RepID=UPI001126F132|nr:DUF6587 family protein [Pseudomonas sp. Hp2]